MLLYAVAIGIGATAMSDLWVVLLQRSFGIPAPNYRVFGRWLGVVCAALLLAIWGLEWARRPTLP